MYINISKKVMYSGILLFVYVVLPVKNAFAITTGGTPNPSTTGGTPNEGSGGSGAADPVYLENPLEGTVDSLPDLVRELLNIVLIIGTPLVALAIIFAGFMLVAAQGNPEKLQKARQALLWAIVGGAVLLGSYVLAQAIGGTVEQLTN